MSLVLEFEFSSPSISSVTASSGPMIDLVLAAMLFRQYIVPELRIVPDLYGS